MSKKGFFIRIFNLYLMAIVFIFLTCCQNQPKKPNEYQADIVIYGGKLAAITAAIQAIQLGKTVLVVSPVTLLDGLSSGGLGFIDTGNKSTIGGLSREFYHRVWLHYNDSAAWKWQKHSEYGNKGQGTVAMDGENRTMWIFEPHVAENNITFLRDE